MLSCFRATDVANQSKERVELHKQHIVFNHILARTQKKKIRVLLQYPGLNFVEWMVSWTLHDSNE